MTLQAAVRVCILDLDTDLDLVSTPSTLLSSLDRSNVSNSLILALELPPPTATPFAAAEYVILVRIMTPVRDSTSEIATARIYKANASTYATETNEKMPYRDETGFCLAAPPPAV